MSVFRFDPDDPKNPFPYLAEKSLIALQEAARLVDLANEPGTAEWYAQELRGRAERIRAAGARLRRARIRQDAAVRDGYVVSSGAGTVRQIERREFGPDRTEVRVVLVAPRPSPRASARSASPRAGRPPTPPGAAGAAVRPPSAGPTSARRGAQTPPP